VLNYMMRYLPAYHPCTRTAQCVYGNWEKSLEQWHLLCALKTIPWV